MFGASYWALGKKFYYLTPKNYYLTSIVMDFSKKGNREFFNERLLFKTVGVVFLIGIVVLIVVDFKIYQKKQELTSQVNAYKKQIEDIQRSSQTIKEEIANADNIDYLEKLGYEQFDQTRPGETEYMFIKPQKKAEVVSGSENFWGAKSWFGWVGDALNWLKNRF